MMAQSQSQVRSYHAKVIDHYENPRNVSLALVEESKDGRREFIGRTGWISGEDDKQIFVRMALCQQGSEEDWSALRCPGSVCDVCGVLRERERLERRSVWWKDLTAGYNVLTPSSRSET